MLQAVQTFTCPSFFYFHVGNAFESDDGSTLHVDLAVYDDPQILLDLSLQPLVSPALGPDGQLLQQVSKSYYKRLSIPLNSKRSTARIQVSWRQVAAGHDSLRNWVTQQPALIASNVREMLAPTDGCLCFQHLLFPGDDHLTKFLVLAGASDAAVVTGRCSQAEARSPGGLL